MQLADNQPLSIEMLPNRLKAFRFVHYKTLKIPTHGHVK